MSHAASFFLAAARAVASGGAAATASPGARPRSWASSSASPPRCAGRTRCCSLLPAATLVLARRSRPGAGRGPAARPALGWPSPLGVLPQLLAWKAIFGTYLLADPPQGRDFLRLDRPSLLETFFSSRHGLLFWTPVLWAGFLGYLLASCGGRPAHAPCALAAARSWS